MLLLISEATNDLNYILMRTSTLGLLWDIHTKEIIYCCIQRDGLYYVDEVTRVGKGKKAMPITHPNYNTCYGKREKFPHGI